MQHCPICQSQVILKKSGIYRCLTGHIIMVPWELSVALELSNVAISGNKLERTPVPPIFQEAFAEGELDA